MVIRTRLASKLALGMLAGLAGAASAFPTTYIAVCDSGNDTIALFDASTGALVQADWIRYSDWGLDASSATPKDAIRVGNQLWVSDQVQDTIHRFTLDRAHPQYLGSIAAGLDNLRGMEFHNGIIYVSNSGSANNAPGQAIVKLNRRGQNMGFFTCGDPFDVTFRPATGDLLIANSADDDIDRYSLAGAFLGKYHNSDGVTGINFPEQIAIDPTGVNDIYVTGFSAPVGVYSYKNGGQTAVYAGIPGPRGIAPVDGGKFLITDGSNVRLLTPSTGQSPVVYSDSGGSFQFANRITFYCPADVNADGFVNGDDYDLFASQFDAGDAEADFNGDTFVNADDYDAFASAFDAGC